MALRAYQYKLKVTPAQEADLIESLALCRYIYNRARWLRKQRYELEGKSTSYLDQQNNLDEIVGDWDVSKLHSQVKQDVLRRVDKAFRAFFRRVKAGEKPGYPRYKPEFAYDSLTYPQFGNGVKFKGNRIVFSKLGSFRYFDDRPIEGTPKTATIKRKADGWYVTIICEVEPKPLPPTGRSVGIDLGSESFLATSDGEYIENPKPYRRAERKIKRNHRTLTRRVKGSTGRAKARNQLARSYQKSARVREDFHKKVAWWLVSQYDSIVVEDLNIEGMVQNHNLSKSIHDAGWASFLSLLTSRAESAARLVQKVNPAYTSQMCSGCGELVPKDLSERWHDCPYCGLRLHRDHNAAINILKKGGGTALVEPVNAGDEARTPRL